MIKSKKNTIGLIGLGYVGLPLALQFIICKQKKVQNNKVIGYDINQRFQRIFYTQN